MSKTTKIILIGAIGILIFLTIIFFIALSNLSNNKKTFDPSSVPDTSVNPSSFPTQNIRSNSEPFDYTTPVQPQGSKQDTRPVDMIRDEQAFQRQNNPDVYLANFTPYETSSFSIYADFKKEPTGHFYFLVYLHGSNKAESRNAFISWVKSLQLSDEQIQSLDIQYFDQ